MSLHLTKRNARLILVLVGLFVGIDWIGLTGSSQRLVLGGRGAAIAKPSDPGGEFSIDFAAAEPTSYDHKTGGGAFNDRTINTDVVESLQGGNFVCGDIVTYLMEITVGSGLEETSSIDLGLQFLADTTGQSGVAHDDIVYVGVNYGAVQNGDGPNGTDAGMNDDGGSVATLLSETFNGEVFTQKATLNGVVRVSDMEANETVILRVDVHVTCDPGSSPTGNLQGAITDADVVLPNADKINVGNQTIPFKISGIIGIDDPLLSLSKTVSEDLTGSDTTGSDAITVAPATTVRHLYKLTNNNSRDIFDVSIVDDNGTPTDDSDDIVVNPNNVVSGTLSDLDGEGDLGDLPVGSTVVFYVDVPVSVEGTVVSTAVATGNSGLPDGQNQTFTDSDGASVTVLAESGSGSGSNSGSDNASLSSQVWEDTNFDGIQDAGEPGLDGVVVNLLANNGTVEDTQTTSGGGFYSFTDIEPGNYRLEFESPTGYVQSLEPNANGNGNGNGNGGGNGNGNGKGKSNANRANGKSKLIQLVAGETNDEFTAGFSRDSDGDTIPDVVEGTGDRDNDGTPDYLEADPAGYFYDETTGLVIAGGSISVSPTTSVNIADDGSETGFYQWFIGTNDSYTMTITPPSGYELSTTCLPTAASYAPAGNVATDPTIVLGQDLNSSTGKLVSFDCGDNPYYLTFDLETTDPFVINNNIPLKVSSSPQPPTTIFGVQESFTDCFGVGNSSYSPSGNAGAEDLPCQSYEADLYENWDPNVQGTGDTDIQHFDVGYDSNFFYFRWDLRENWDYDNSGPSRNYYLDIEADAGTAGGDDRADFSLRFDPSTIFQGTTWQAVGDSKGFIYEDIENFVGCENLDQSDSKGCSEGFKGNVSLNSDDFYVRIIDDRVEVAIRPSVIGSPSGIRTRAYATQTSTLSPDKLYWHDANDDTDLSSFRFDYTHGSDPCGWLQVGTGTNMASCPAVTSTPNLFLVKRVTAINSTAITGFIDDPGTTDDTDAQWPANYLQGSINANTAEPGDEIEYTIYFLSSGTADLKNVNLCDLIPTNTTYVDGSGEIALGTNPATPWDDTRTTDAGEYIAPATTTTAASVPGIGLCRADNDTTQDFTAAENPNGAVWVEIDKALTPLPAGQVGYIRFRVQVNETAIAP